MESTDRVNTEEEMVGGVNGFSPPFISPLSPFYFQSPPSGCTIAPPVALQ